MPKLTQVSIAGIAPIITAEGSVEGIGYKLTATSGSRAGATTLVRLGMNRGALREVIAGQDPVIELDRGQGQFRFEIKLGSDHADVILEASRPRALGLWT